MVTKFLDLPGEPAQAADGRVITSIVILILLSLLCSCASSDLSRNAACQFDNAYDHFTVDSCNLGKGNIADAYQNYPQSTKGALIGGIAGGVVGGFTNSVGAVLGLASGAIIGGALGAYIDAHSSLIDKLENRGVKVFMLGDQIKIVIFSNQLFYGMTPNIRYDAYSTLDMIVCLINSYINMSVEVAAYTNSMGSCRVNLGISQQQANCVAKYLWRRCVRTRFLYSVGKGATNKVARDGCDWCEGPNYRVEITFQRLPLHEFC